MRNFRGYSLSFGGDLRDFAAHYVRERVLNVKKLEFEETR